MARGEGEVGVEAQEEELGAASVPRCCLGEARRRLDGADGGRVSAGWPGTENEVELRLLREEIPMWIWKAAAGDGTHLLDFRVCPNRLGVEHIYITD